MAAADCVASFKKLITSLDEGTKVLQSKGQRMLSTHCSSIMTAVGAIYGSTAVLPEWHMTTQTATATAAAEAVMGQNIESIKSCSVFVPALIASMLSIVPDPKCHHKNRATKEMFQLLFLPMLTFKQLPLSWPTQQYLHHNTQLYNTLNSLAVYLLSRKPSSGTAHVVLNIAVNIMTHVSLLLHTTVKCLRPISDTVDCSVLAALPPGFTNNLCCLACEEFGCFLLDQDTMSAKLLWAELSSLLSLVVICVLQAKDAADHQHLCKVLLGPGALEASKMLKLVYSRAEFQGESGVFRAGSDLKHLLAWCGGVSGLKEMQGLAYEHLHHQNQDSDFTLTSGYASNGTTSYKKNSSRESQRTAASASLGSSGSSSLNEQAAAPRVTVIDAHLNYALCSQSRRDPSSMVTNTKLMFLILACATCGPLKSIAQHPADAIAVARHCSFQVVLWMRDQQSRQVKKLHLQLGQAGPQEEPQSVGGLTEVAVEGTKLGLPDLGVLMGASAAGWSVQNKKGMLIDVGLVAVLCLRKLLKCCTL